MDFREYQLLASRTFAPDQPFEKKLSNAGLGLSGEAGEIADHIKKVIHHGHEIDRDYVVKELGDLFWYAAYLASILEIDLNLVPEENDRKLRERYPDGFDKERSKNRKSLGVE